MSVGFYPQGPQILPKDTNTSLIGGRTTSPVLPGNNQSIGGITPIAAPSPDRQALIDALMTQAQPAALPEAAPSPISLPVNDGDPFSAGIARASQNLSNAYRDRRHQDKMGTNMPDKPNWMQRQLGLGKTPTPKALPLKLGKY